MAPHLTMYAKQRILYYHGKGIRAYKIAKHLKTEKIRASPKSVWRFLKSYAETGSMLRRSGSGRPTKVTPDILSIVNGKMEEDDETTAHQLHKLLNERGYQLSITTIVRCRMELGWTFRGSAYCQMIRDVNKQKRKEWALQYLNEAQTENCFQSVIWTDESSIQIETHKRYCFRHKDSPPKRKPRYLNLRFKLCKQRRSIDYIDYGTSKVKACNLSLADSWLACVFKVDLVAKVLITPYYISSVVILSLALRIYL